MPSSTRGSRKKRQASPPLLRTSERSSWMTCRWAWDREFNDKLKPVQDRPALRFGSLVHAALEKRYPKGIRRGPKPAETFEQLYDADLAKAEKAWGFQVEEEWADAKDIGVYMLEEYVKEYGRDEEWEVLGSEMTFKVPVWTPEHPDGGYMALDGTQVTKKRIMFYYVGTMDGVWKNRMSGGVLINDYKTTKGDPMKEGASKSVLDEQATAYWTWGVDFLIRKKMLRPKDEQALAGMLYTMLRKAKRDLRPVNAHGEYLNQDGSVSQRQPAPLFHRELVYRSDADREAARVRAVEQVMEMYAARNGDLAIYKNPKTGSMGHCGWCQYFDLCELHELGTDWESLRNSTMTTWDPYAAHEIEEEGKAR